MSGTIVYREVGADDWAGFREIRLRMLAEIPIAFTEHLADALRVTDAQWRARVDRATRGGAVRFAALEERSGRWVGTMAGVLPAHRSDAMLVGVYVEPAHRGREAGVTDALLELVERWAAGHRSRLALEVHESNARARAAYVSRGFVPTGVTVPYPLDPSSVEIEMAKDVAVRPSA
jgi:GNAT superfamily N-acetyltransferase